MLDDGNWEHTINILVITLNANENGKMELQWEKEIGLLSKESNNSSNLSNRSEPAQVEPWAGIRGGSSQEGGL